MSENKTGVDDNVIQPRPLPGKPMEYNNVTPTERFPMEDSYQLDLRFIMSLIFGLTFAAAFFLSLIQVTIFLI